MIVYHGSTIEVRHPDVNHSYRNLDFGKGFYETYDQIAFISQKAIDQYLEYSHIIEVCL